MTDTTTHLRQTERDLYVAAEELRDDAADIETQRETMRQEFAGRDESDIPTAAERKYQRLGQQRRELLGTAETYEHYANEWGDGETCVFTLEELNGDEYAAVVDAVSAEAQKQARRDGSIPEGYGRIKALEYGVIDVPTGCPATPGEWPAPIVNELFSALEELTSPSGVDMGNESLASAVSDDTPATPPMDTPPSGLTESTPAPPDEG